MHRILKKDQILTIPNLLSVVRILLIPVIAWLYLGRHQVYWATAVVLLSGLTDVADGWIARKFNMVSDFGKILDPVADKLTQLTMLICLIARYRLMIPLVVLFVIKELIMSVVGLKVICSKDVVDGAKWFGKLNTVVIYTVVIILFLCPGIPMTAANIMIGICAVTVAVSMVLYLLMFAKRLKK